LQARENNQYGVFIVTESEGITISYERDETDYRIAHTLNTKIDELGNVLESASVVYGRNQAKADTDFQLLFNNITNFSEDVLNNNAAQKTLLQNAFNDNIHAAKDEQTEIYIIYTQNSFAKYKVGATEFDDIDLSHAYRLRLPYEAKTYELTGFLKANDLFKLTELEDALSLATEIEYHEVAVGVTKSRLFEHVKTKYLDDDLNTLDFGYFNTLGLPYESYQLAYTPDLVTGIYSKNGTELQAGGADVSSLIKAKGNFSEFNNDGLLWIRSGFIHFKDPADVDISTVRERFFSPLAFEDPYGAITSVKYDIETITGDTRNNDGYYLFIKDTTDVIDNKVQIDVFNYRTMSPSRMIDLNANPSSVLVNELGLVKALAVEGNGVFSDATRTTVTIQKAADDLIGLTEYQYQHDDKEKDEQKIIERFFQTSTNNSTNTVDLRKEGNRLLKHATSRFVYDFDIYKKTSDKNNQYIVNGEPEKVIPLPPVVVASIVREEHHNIDKNKLLKDRKFQFSFEYSDGLGNVAMTKVQAEPGMAHYMEYGAREEKDTSP
ncbi:MAG: hypothetical protein KAS32_11390, partial [Candidatus Peribacteraceae bacterium]|nr:hypothetical protein [Candidatus Peribacteraceae bacterium]